MLNPAENSHSLSVDTFAHRYICHDVCMIDDVFAVIADPTRRQILRVLAAGKRPVGDLVDELGVSQPTVSKHLKVLRNAGLVDTQAVGQKRFYSLTPEPLENVLEWIRSLNQCHTQTLNILTPWNKTTDKEQTDEVSNTVEPAQTATNNSEHTDQQSDPEPVASADEKAPFEKTEQDLASSDVSHEQQTPDEECTPDIFEFGEPGDPRQRVRTSESHSAISFTPLMPFVPRPLDPPPEDLDEPEKNEEQPTSTEYASSNTLEETTEEHPPAWKQQESEHLTESETEDSQVQVLPALPTAAEISSETQNNSAQDSRGLFATLTRWGRRRPH